MPIQWTDDLTVGVKEIDDQHQELFKRVNELSQAMWDGKGKEESKKLMDFLGDYVVSHFGTEQRIMSAKGYPEYESHKKIHEKFINDLMNLKKQFDSGEATSSMVIQVLDETCEWLKSHIRKVDKRLGDFLRT
jgi:hemerythrin